jgi:hypothetical protein
MHVYTLKVYYVHSHRIVCAFCKAEAIANLFLFVVSFSVRREMEDRVVLKRRRELIFIQPDLESEVGSLYRLSPIVCYGWLKGYIVPVWSRGIPFGCCQVAWGMVAFPLWLCLLVFWKRPVWGHRLALHLKVSYRTNAFLCHSGIRFVSFQPQRSSLRVLILYQSPGSS